MAVPVLAMVAGLIAVTGSVATAAVASSVAAATLPTPVLLAAPGSPGVPQVPELLYLEDFENEAATSPMELEDYPGSDGTTYTADSYWLRSQRCNGFILDYSVAVLPSDQYCNDAQEQWDRVRVKANALGLLNSPQNAATNRAVSSNSTGGTDTDIVTDSVQIIETPNAIEFATSGQLALPSASGRFVTFSVDAAATACGLARPSLRFYLRDDAGVEHPVSAASIDPCTSPGNQSVTVDGESVSYGSFAADTATLMAGDSLGIVLRNEQGNSNGNDGAFDNIKVLDVTPQLDKSFSPSSVPVGDISTLTLTVTNTSELASKDGWSFTDTLPAGLTVASSPAASTTCPAGAVTAEPGSSTVGATGNLDAGMQSCTVTVNVTSDQAGDYTNGPDNVDVTGLNPPGESTVTFIESSWSCDPYGYLFQTNGPLDAPHTVTRIDLATGAATDAGLTADYVNAVGYNTLDDYFYAWDVTTSSIVRINSDLSLTDMGLPDGLAVSTYITGDFDDSGHFWITTNATPTVWAEIDYAPGSPTYGTVLNQGEISTGSGSVPSDWSFVGDGLYGVRQIDDSPVHLFAFDPATGASVDQGVLDGPSDWVGAGATYSDGTYLYGSDNPTGNIYRIDPTTRETILVTPGPASSGNDGARCATAPIPTITVSKTAVGRASGDDQFTVGLHNAAGDTLTSVTTSGSTTGAASTVSTPNWPVSPGASYTITDAMAAGSTSDITTYNATISCETSDGATVPVTGEGPWEVTSSETDAITCEVTNTPIRTLSLQKSSDVTAAARIGDTVTYTVTATNTGGSDFTADDPAQVIDDLTEVLDDASFDGTVAVDGSDVDAAYAEPRISWSGPLAAGASITLKYSVVLNGQGDQQVRNVAFQPPPCLDEPCDPPVTPNPPDCPTTGGTDPETGLPCASTDLPLPKLTVTKSSPDLATAQIGDTVHYEVTATNTGMAGYTADDPARMVDDLTNVLDDATYNDDAAIADGGPGAVAYAEPQITWAGALDVADSVTVSYSVVLTGGGDQAVDNIVFEAPTCDQGPCDPPVPPNPNDCVANDNIDPVTGLSCAPLGGGVPKLAITKTASDSDQARIGDTITWTVTATNVGTEPFTDEGPAVITDDLADVLDDATFDGAVTVTGSDIDAQYSQPQIGWRGPLAEGESITLSYSTVLTGAGDGEIANVAWQLPPDPDPSCELGTCEPPNPPECQDIGSINPATGLPCASVSAELPRPELDKASPDLATAHVGDTVTFTVTFTNTGPGDYTAQRPAQIADDLSGALDDATFDGDIAVSGSDIPAEYSGGQIVWTGPVAAGASVTLTYRMVLTGQGDLQVVNLAYVPPAPPVCTTADCPTPPNPTPPECVDNVDPATGLPCKLVEEDLPKLELAKSSPDLATAEIGDTVTFTVTGKNIGKRDFGADDPAQLFDDLTGVLDDATFDGKITVKGSKVTASYSDPRIEWAGPLAVGAAVTLNYQVVLTGKGDLSVRNVAFVPPAPPACQTDDCPAPPVPPTPDCSTDGVDPITGLPCAEVVEGLSDLLIEKSSDAPAIIKVGDIVTYTITATNTGIDDYTADQPAVVVDDLTEVLDDATFDGIVEVGGSEVDAAYTEPQISWIGPLAAGAKVTVTYRIEVTAAGDLDLLNVAFVAGSDPDCLTDGSCPVPDPECATGDNPTCAVVDDPLPGLYVEKSVDKSTVGTDEVITYTVAMTNTGQVDFTTADPAVLTDDLSDVLDDAAYREDAVADLDGTLTYSDPELSWSGALAIGATVTLTYTAVVNGTVTGDGTLRNVAAIPEDITPRYPNGQCPNSAAQCDPPSPTAETVSNVDPADPPAIADPPVINTGDAGLGTGPSTPMVLAGSGLLLLILACGAYWLVSSRRRRSENGIEGQLG